MLSAVETGFVNDPCFLLELFHKTSHVQRHFPCYPFGHKFELVVSGSSFAPGQGFLEGDAKARKDDSFLLQANKQKRDGNLRLNALNEKRKKWSAKARLIAAAVGGLVVATGAGVVSYSAYLKNQDLYSTYCQVGNHNVSKVDFEFFYNSSISNFVTQYGSYISQAGIDLSKPFSEQIYDEQTGQTWETFFQNQAYSTMKETFLLADAAAEDKSFTSTTKTYDDFIKGIGEYVKENNMTEQQYINQVYGPNATRSNLEKVMKTYFTANDYAKYLQDKKLKPDDKAIEDYYKKVPDLYDEVTFRAFAFKANVVDDKGNPVPAEERKKNMAEAEKKAQTFYNQVYDEETFKKLCIENSEGDAKKRYTEEDASLFENKTSDQVMPAYAQWLFSAERKENATAVIEDPEAGAYYVVFFKSRRRNDDPTVTVRHLLITPDQVEEPKADASDKEREEFNKKKEAAKKSAHDKAQKLYDDWKNAKDLTADSFGTLAKENSADKGTSDQGGKMENIAKGQTVEAFDNWIFAKDRKAGDTTVLDTEYGSHVVFFESPADPIWKTKVSRTLVSEGYKNFVGKRESSYPFKDARGSLKALNDLLNPKKEEKKDENTNSQSTAGSPESSQEKSEEKPASEQKAG